MTFMADHVNILLLGTTRTEKSNILIELLLQYNDQKTQIMNKFMGKHFPIFLQSGISGQVGGGESGVPQV